MVLGRAKSGEPIKLTNGFDSWSPLFGPEHGYVNNGGSPLACCALWGSKSNCTWIWALHSIGWLSLVKRWFFVNYSIFNSTNFNSNSNSRIGIGIELQFQFRNWIDPNPVTCPHNTPHIPSCYNNEQTAKQTKALNNSYIYISHVNVAQTVPDISPLMLMHQDPLLVYHLNKLQRGFLMKTLCLQNCSTWLCNSIHTEIYMINYNIYMICGRGDELSAKVY